MFSSMVWRVEMVFIIYSILKIHIWLEYRGGDSNFPAPIRPMQKLRSSVMWSPATSLNMSN